MRDARALALWLCAAGIAATVAGCARKMPPTGGPPDLEPPFIVAVTPDSGATAVDRGTRLTVEFSEGMETRSAALAVEIAPAVEVKQRRWSGRKLTLVLGDSLRRDRTYTLFVGTDARDGHGNPLRSGRAVPFTTAARFPAGHIEGVVVATGFTAPGTYLWCYPEGQAPDSTARDFVAVGLANDLGAFGITGLEVPGRYRVWAFADLNRNHSFEPDKDLLVPAETTLVLTTGQPTASGLQLRVLNPKAPGRVQGVILDSLKDERGELRLVVLPASDTTRRLLYDIDAQGTYDFNWEPGSYRVFAFRDFDKNKTWKRDEEPGSIEISVVVPAGGAVELPVLVLVRARPSGGSP